ncbi:MFS transporter [Arthrobacter cupressi]|uniref:Sugar transporter n=1 Tax=Arthrobacter cupressi TaxID=1045773 RepID=A0A1G8V885_9MICC|nr:MFS transporter [Arthrobacter cupressi]NYD78663.1 MFS family permease [Arthrobacter cupressi]SDJ62104.1 Sugar transporter [Arthrobacter cupressi]
MSISSATPVIDEKVTKRVALGALVGTALEWYDFFLFTTASALVFNIQFFATKDPILAGIFSFGTLAVGFVARPVGGLIFGALGDKVGRKKILMITIVGIGVVTGLIGLLPTYAAIGVAAPVLLILLRIVQGLAVGGEWSGAMIIAVENAPVEKRGRYGAMPQLGSPIGTILSSGGFALLAFLLSKDSFDDWGWRIPFLLAIPLLLVSLWIRSRLSESPEFEALMEEGETEHAPIRGVLGSSWKQVLVGAATAMLGVGGFYLVTTFVVFYGTTVLKLDRNLLLAATLIAAVFEVFILIGGGRMAERFGASRVVITGGLLSAILAFPVFLAVQSKDPFLVIFGVTLGVCALSIPYAVSGAVLTGLFPTRTRYTGVAISSNLAGLLSGFVPMVATATLAASGNSWVPSAWLLIGISLLTAVAGLAIPSLSIKQQGLKA